MAEPGQTATVFKILQVCEEPKSVQEIAEEVKISYTLVLEHLIAIGKNVQLR